VNPDSQPYARRWPVLALIFAGIFISYVDRGNLSIAAVSIMRDLDFSPARMGALLSAFFWTYGVMQIPAGYLVDRFGIRGTYALAFVVWSLSCAGTGMVGSFGAILAFRLLLGAGEAVAPVASLRFIKTNFAEKQQGIATAVYISGQSLGPATGAWLGAQILDWLGWRELFIIMGLGALIWIVPWLFLAPRDSGRTHQSSSSAPAVPLRSMLSGRTAIGLASSAFLYSYYWYFYLTWVPSYLLLAGGYTNKQMGVITALPLVVSCTISLASGWFADRLIGRGADACRIRKQFVCTGFLVSSVVVILALPGTTGIALPVLVVSLFGIGIASANYWALTQVVSPASAVGRIVGFQNTSAQLGGVVAPLLTGFLLGETKNFSVAFVLSAVAMLLALVGVWWLVERKQESVVKAEVPSPI